MEFRKLNANEIEARIGSISKEDKGVTVLLYKNARCDMNILDESVGALNWQRDHKEIKGNMYAGIGIWDAEKSQWIWKWDCGTESYTEGEKGEASDSFKRACFNLGIGRELYTAPLIYFTSKQANITNGKCYDTFTVEAIEYEGNKISFLKVVNDKTKAVKVFGKSKDVTTQAEAEKISNFNEEVEKVASEKISKAKADAMLKRLQDADADKLKNANISMGTIKAKYKIGSIADLTEADYMDLHLALNKAGV